MALFITKYLGVITLFKLLKKIINNTPDAPTKPKSAPKPPEKPLTFTEKKKQSFDYNLKITKQLGEDLLHSGTGVCCSKCAPFSNRIFSYSGKDTRFPKFHDYIAKPEEYCCLNFSGIYYYDKMKLTVYKYDSNGNVKQKEVDAIKHSNRPFVDDRSEYEIKLAEKHQKRMEKLNNK